MRRRIIMLEKQYHYSVYSGIKLAKRINVRMKKRYRRYETRYSRSLDGREGVRANRIAEMIDPWPGSRSRIYGRRYVEAHQWPWFTLCSSKTPEE